MRQHLATLVESFRRNGEETAVVLHRGVRRFATSYAALAELAGRFAAKLNLQGIAPGERVVIWGANSAEWIAVFFGCLLRGVLAVPLDAAGSAEFAERVIREVAPRLITGDAVLLAKLQGAHPTLAFSALPGVLPSEPEFAVSAEVQPGSAFQIVFTSGTTAEPKGIVHTHRNVLASLDPIEREMVEYRRYERLVHPLRFLHTLPLSHVFGQFMGLWLPALLSAELHFSDAPESSGMLRLLRRERVSVLVAVPRLLALLERHLLQRFPDLTGKLAQRSAGNVAQRWWRFRAMHRALGWKFWAVISGGAALPHDTEAFWNALGFALIQGYGMTETSALVTLNHPFHVGRGSIGKPLPGREVRLTDKGEILVRGDVVAEATWQNGTMQPRVGEWLATGDLAEQNPGGELRFLGRAGDAIVTAAGMNVHPADLETVVQKQPDVRQCVVVPCPFGNAVEPVAVVLFAGSEAALQETLWAANRELDDYQTVRRILRWPELSFPYTATGKLLRRKVSAWACAQLAAQAEARVPALSTGDWLTEGIAAITGMPSVEGGDERRLTEDLHLDSLGRVQLAAALEQQTGVGLDTETLARMETLGQLRSALVPTLLVEQTRRAAVPSESSGALRSRKAAEERSTATDGAPGAWPSRSGPVAGVVSRSFGAGRGESLSYPRWPRRWPVRPLRSFFARWIVRPLVHLLGAPRIVRLTESASREPQLIIANHVTAFDTPLIMAALPEVQSRRLAVAMSGELLNDLRHARGQGTWWRNLLAPAAYWLITALFNVFPLPRMRGLQRSFRHAGEALDRGDSVLIFPEGARSKDGTLQGFRPGIGLLAQQAQVPVLPVALMGLGEVRAQGRGWFRSGQIGVRVGSSIPYDETLSPGQWTALLEAAVRRLGAP